MTREEAVAWTEVNAGAHVRFKLRCSLACQHDHGEYEGIVTKGFVLMTSMTDWAPASAAFAHWQQSWFLPKDIFWSDRPLRNDLTPKAASPRATACECGAVKCGFSTHSPWCPLGGRA